MPTETKTYTVLVCGHGLWGAGDSEKEALSNVPYSVSYMREKGYNRIEFGSPVTDIQVGPFGVQWTWVDENEELHTHVDTEIAPKRKS